MRQSVAPEFVRLAEHMAEAAGDVIRNYFRQAVTVDDKDDASPVTIADREAEKRMREIIADAAPEHGIIGEEWGTQRGDADYVWVLDPIDGTKSFISGLPIFGILIGLMHRGQAVLGVIDQPVTGERWVGVNGETRFNGTPVRTRACANISDATLFAHMPGIPGSPNNANFQKLRQGAKLVRYSADCYAYGVLASGFIDMVADDEMKLHDYCALIPIIEGAGGTITDWRGRPLPMDGTGSPVLASGDARAHKAAIAIMGE